MRKVVWAGLGLGLMAAQGALAQETAGRPEVVLDSELIFQASITALTALLVLAVLLENGLAVIFNWRVFQAYFSGRGVRTIVMVVVACLLVWGLELDVVASLIGAYKTPPNAEMAATVPSQWITKLVTALILAGGSSGVHNIMKTLGFRSAREEALLDLQPITGKAWLAIRATQQNTIGEVLVRIRDLGQAPEGSPAPVAGMIPFHRQRLVELLFRSPRRFPQSGGYELVPNRLYEITVEGRSRDGHRIVALEKAPFVFADRAIVDLELKL